VAAWALLLFPHFLFAILFAAVTATGGAVAPWTTVAAATLVVGLSAGMAFPLGRAIGLLRPAPPMLARAIARALQGTGRRPPRAYELRIASANAFALPQLDTVAATTDALRALDEDELTAVMRHEVAHLDEGRRVRLLRVLHAATLPLAMILAAGLLRFSSLATPVALLVLFILWVVGGKRLHRPMEERADAAAHADAQPYARALEKLHQRNLAPAVLGRKGGHPDLYDRMLAAGVTPDWPRPEPPPRNRRSGIAAFVLVLVSTVGLTLAPTLDAIAHPDARGPLVRGVALHGSPSDVAALGRWHYEHGQFVEALAFYGAAEAMAPTYALYPAVQASALVALGRCDEAARALQRAARASGSGGYVATVREEVAGCGRADAEPYDDEPEGDAP
jgi:Zn-dependent protease with chaperone function